MKPELCRSLNPKAELQSYSTVSVFVDPKDPYSMELGQFWEEDTEEGACVD